MNNYRTLHIEHKLNAVNRLLLEIQSDIKLITFEDNEMNKLIIKTRKMLDNVQK